MRLGGLDLDHCKSARWPSFRGYRDEDCPPRGYPRNPHGETIVEAHPRSFRSGLGQFQ